MAATGIDGFRTEQLDTVAVAPLVDTELRLAAQRAGLLKFDLLSGDSSRLRGALTALRGAVGERWVLGQLQGRQLPTPEGAVAAELLPFNTPGVDIVFTDRKGELVGSANVKVASTADVVARHFERHPNVSIIYATSDAAADASARGIRVVESNDMVISRPPVVVDIGRSSSDFDHQIGETLATGGVARDGWIDLVPWASSAAIGVRAMLRLCAGTPSREVALHAGREATTAGSATTIAHLASRVTNSEPTVALLAMVASATTIGTLGARRSWTTLANQLIQLAANAENIAARFTQVSKQNLPTSKPCDLK